MPTKIRMEIPDTIKVELSDYTADQVLNNIAEASALELSKDLEVSWQELKNEAAIFLSSIKSLDENYAALTLAQLKQVVLNPEIASYADQIQGTREKFYVQSLYMLAARFEDYLSRFRKEDKERSMLYVFTSPDGKQVETYEMTLREFIINADKHGRWSDISKKKLTANNRLSKEQEGFFSDEHVKEAQFAYEGTLNRYMRYFEKHPKKQKQNALVMWKENKEWMLGNIVNTGDLKEAYVSYLFAEHNANILCSLNTGSEPYYGDEFIGSFYKNYVAKVTNLEAVLEEDVLTTDKQYGIKGRKASLPSLQQYIDSASLILSQEKPWTKEQLEEGLNIKFKRGDESKGARNMTIPIKKALEEGLITPKDLSLTS